MLKETIMDKQGRVKLGQFGYFWCILQFLALVPYSHTITEPNAAQHSQQSLSLCIFMALKEDVMYVN